MAINSPIDRSNVAQDWDARGFSCALRIDHTEREWSYRAHETDELFMMISGELELELEGRWTRPSVGEEICIPAGTPHTIRNVRGKTAHWLYGQQREAILAPQIPDTVSKRSSHPEVKRKRRPEKKIPALDVSKEAGTHSIL